jgi:preprotein translocase YajC subunit
MTGTTFLFSLMAPQGGRSGGLSILLFQIVAIGLVFYFLVIRPQARRGRSTRTCWRRSRRSDEIMTPGGSSAGQGHPGERITVESGTSTVVIDRARIVRIGDSVAPGQ